MDHDPRATTIWNPARLLGAVGAALLLTAVAMTAPAPGAAQKGEPYIWVETHDRRPPCYTEYCFRIAVVPGVAIAGTNFAPYGTVQVRFVSLDGTRESFTYKVEADSAAGDFRIETGESVCNAWLNGSPLVPTGLPDEHAWEVRAGDFTTKPGVPSASNILFIYTCGDGPVG